MEFGVGIHGEPGIDRRPFTSLNDTVDAMFNTLIENGHYQRTIRSWDRVNGDWIEETQEKQPLKSGDRVIALVNNLGATPFLNYMVFIIALPCAVKTLALTSNVR